MSDLIASLNQLQADYQVYYQKLRAFHWNVRGPMFFALHAKFEELYTAFAVKVDDLAERALTLGGRPLPTLTAVLEKARIQEVSKMPDAMGMVQALAEDLVQLNTWTRVVAAKAEEAEDVGTVNLLEGFADGQEKEVWMLRSFLQG
ncbi:MAG: DNA starvation/stationary phase protection protein [Planctomycetota bacterium]